jgi:hypothetical protein
MATTTVFLSGTCKWAKVYKPDEKYKNWQIQLYPDDESMKVYDQSGMSMAKKEDEAGVFITFRRPESKLIKNEVVEFAPPVVKDKLGRTMDKLIGNGSKVAIKVSVYDTMKGKGHRLEEVKVLDLVEYQKSNTEGSSASVLGVPFA